ncbi:AraC family transcriptional regulator [Bifidobacterium mongoliense]|uniref:AraC family transcriptional regulator n=1 Tax=Bifidobacterium mongoliense TaxID=518643 RepID=UPI0030EC763B
MEHIVSFVPGQFARPERFRIHMAGVTYPDRTYHIVRERSDIYCIEYVVEGSGDVICGDRHAKPGPGDVYLLPPGVRHDYRSSAADPYKKIWMNVSGLLCDALYREYHLANGIVYPGETLRPLFSRFLALCEDCGNGDDGRLSLDGALIVHSIFAQLAQRHLDDRLISSSERYASRIRTYLDRRVEDNIRLGAAARDLGLSVSQLSRLFVQAYGISPYRYYLQQRMDLARALLSNTGMRIQEISLRLHYADAHYFSTQFSANVGMSPRRYRERGAGRAR